MQNFYLQTAWFPSFNLLHAEIRLQVKLQAGGLGVQKNRPVGKKVHNFSLQVQFSVAKVY